MAIYCRFIGLKLQTRRIAEKCNVFCTEGKKKKEYKDDFFKNNIDSVAMQPV
jgi:hypothetical protein